MQRLEVSDAVRPKYGSLGVKRLNLDVPAKSLPVKFQYVENETLFELDHRTFQNEPLAPRVSFYCVSSSSYSILFLSLPSSQLKKNTKQS